MNYLGVITGDIVESRAINSASRRALYADLKTFLSQLKKEKWIDTYELYRGDSFHCASGKKENMLRVALLIRAYIKFYQTSEERENPGKADPSSKSSTSDKQDIRLSIGIGPVEFYDPKSLGHSDGEAFRLSGEQLDVMKKMPYRLSLKTSNETFNESLEPSIMLLDAVLQKWTGNQAETIFYKLKGSKEEDIAKVLDISQPAVNQRAHTAQWFAIDKLLTYFEKTLKQWP